MFWAYIKIKGYEYEKIFFPVCCYPMCSNPISF